MIHHRYIGRGLSVFEDRDGEKVVSSLQFFHVQLPSRDLGVIEEVWTHEDYRRQGRATAVIQEALRFARMCKLDCIELTVREDRPDLQEFYKSLGFEDRQNRAMRLKLREKL